MIDWDLVLKEVDNALAFFDSQGVKPTLRTLFYRLVSKNIIPNTKNAYKRLSEKLVEMRKAGRYAWNFLEDTTRVVLGGLRDRRFGDDLFDWFERELERRIDSLDIDKLLNDYFDCLRPYFYVDRWADQPTVCEVWIEKEALAKTIESWVEGWGIPIRVNRGYSSWTFIYNNVQSLISVLERHSRVKVFYLGDLDPSGVDIERFLREAIEYFGLGSDKVELVRLAVTPEQVEMFKLPPRPEDAETIAKLGRDTRSKRYSLSYVVELDALVAYVPDSFKMIINSAISNVWDKSIYESLKARAAELSARSVELLERAKVRAKEKILKDIKEDIKAGLGD